MVDSDDDDDKLPAKNLPRLTSWMHFLKTFATTEGKSNREM